MSLHLTMTPAARFTPRLGDSTPTAIERDDAERSQDRFAARLGRITRRDQPTCGTQS